MSATIPALEAMKDTHRKTWASGDYPAVAELVSAVGEHTATRAGVRPGNEVLDVAAGTGNAAIPAARAGGRVIATDLTPELFVAGRRRAEQAGVDLEWIAADAEDLPFEDERFDVVLSAIGVQFAPRHEVVAAELVRVCRPGGTIALGNWAADGFIGRFWSIMGPFLPTPPAFASPPPGWGRIDHVEELFAEHPVELAFERGSVRFADTSAEAWLDTFVDRYGPVLQARNKLSESGRWTELRDALLAMCEELNVATDGTWAVESEYLVIVARKAA
ncbi:MAG: class I SAM-dependent methyltransferase [Solirubrobacteraceae bacterium]|nr:class I SAM-dependent methyltransferase [Solirubrobacteraceae bacterium]